ncbi:MAG: CCA tRNA nucleotidyltransferase [Rhodospirillales bacterium]|nr:CCA tRNA nucleotidyltransferase [Rhodospirillales bacterium]
MFVSQVGTTEILPTGKLPPEPWISADSTKKVIDALTAEGADVRFVGGCVRDAVVKRPVKDVDIGTPDPPEKITELLERRGIRVIPTGIDHGTVTAVVDDAHFEITTLRLDLATDGRRARVAYTDSWIADAARRDFTINALSCTPEGDIFDPFGGLADLGQGLVRFVGVPRERIEEDYLRLLRFFRFYAEFGRPPPDGESLAACRQYAPELSRLSAERIRSELFRILLAPNAADTFMLMRGEKVLEHVLPFADNIGRLRLISWLGSTALRMDGVSPDPLRRLAALLVTDAEGAALVAERLRLSNRQRERLIALCQPRADIMPDMTHRSLRAVLYREGADLTRDWILMAWASEMARGVHRNSARTQAWIGLLAAAESWQRPDFPLSGGDVTAMGISEGPKVGELLDELEIWWINGDFTADAAACRARLAELIERDITQK